MEKYFKKLYIRFLKSQKTRFIEDRKKHSTSLEDLKVSDKILGEFYDNYYKPTFLGFLHDIKTIIYSDNVFEFITKEALEDWDLYPYLKLLTDEKIIKVSRNGKTTLLKKRIEKFIPKPQTAKQIKSVVEKKLKIKAQDKQAVINLFKKFERFKVKAKWDQMPISAESAFFVAEKILAKIPFNKKFLLVGDDDFISVILTLADPNIECLAIDIDTQLLECIDILAKKFDLKIKTKKVDLSKKKDLKENFVGFLANPIYTEDGIKTFIKFGTDQLGKDGGFVFLEIGDEAIGNRFLFLQEFFSKNNLIINELILNKVYYPHIKLYKEDEVVLKRMTKFINKKTIEKSPKLGAALYIFNYLGKRPRRVKFDKPFYAYL
ncbi:MAG: bis-aminopropyl spermidine synthase family protein [Patescibacteria group bacterium]|nr:bis-aminopropyl spermidine synthase family protein [Patescibacteria group bacterium]